MTMLNEQQRLRSSRKRCSQNLYMDSCVSLALNCVTAAGGCGWPCLGRKGGWGGALVGTSRGRRRRVHCDGCWAPHRAGRVSPAGLASTPEPGAASPWGPGTGPAPLAGLGGGRGREGPSWGIRGAEWREHWSHGCLLLLAQLRGALHTPSPHFFDVICWQITEARFMGEGTGLEKGSGSGPAFFSRLQRSSVGVG